MRICALPPQDPLCIFKTQLTKQQPFQKRKTATGSVSVWAARLSCGFRPCRRRWSWWRACHHAPTSRKSSWCVCARGKRRTCSTPFCKNKYVGFFHGALHAMSMRACADWQDHRAGIHLRARPLRAIALVAARGESRISMRALDKKKLRLSLSGVTFVAISLNDCCVLGSKPDKSET